MKRHYVHSKPWRKTLNWGWCTDLEVYPSIVMLGNIVVSRQTLSREFYTGVCRQQEWEWFRAWLEHMKSQSPPPVTHFPNKATPTATKPYLWILPLPKSLWGPFSSKPPGFYIVMPLWMCSSWEWTRRKRLWLNSDVFVYQPAKRSAVPVSYVSWKQSTVIREEEASMETMPP